MIDHTLNFNKVLILDDHPSWLNSLSTRGFMTLCCYNISYQQIISFISKEQQIEHLLINYNLRFDMDTQRESRFGAELASILLERFPTHHISYLGFEPATGTSDFTCDNYIEFIQYAGNPRP